MRPLDGTIRQAERERVIGICIARNAEGRGNCVIDASDRSLHGALREIGSQGVSSALKRDALADRYWRWDVVAP